MPFQLLLNGFNMPMSKTLTSTYLSIKLMPFQSKHTFAEAPAWHYQMHT
jgi:hypothetical protein